MDSVIQPLNNRGQMITYTKETKEIELLIYLQKKNFGLCLNVQYLFTTVSWEANTTDYRMYVCLEQE